MFTSSAPLPQLHCKLFARMGDDRPFVCSAPGCGQRFTNEDHLAVHRHKHEMTLKFGPARTDSVIIADQTPTPTRFLKNCEEVGLFNELASSFEQEFRKAQEDDNKRAKNAGAVDMSLQTPSDVKVKEEEPVEVDSSPPESPDSISSMSDSGREPLRRGKESPPKPAVSSAPTPTIVRPGSLPLHLGYDTLHPTMPSPTSVITQAPPSNRQLGYVLRIELLLYIYIYIFFSSGSSSPSGYTHSEAKMRLKAALSHQTAAAQSCGGVAMGSSPMVPQRIEQSQLLVQHPDAPSPAQPQVSPAQPTGGRRRRTTEDDPDERRQRFLERNRAAASRCRQKRKLWVNSLEKKAEELTTMNVSLSNEVSLLRNEVAHLKQLLLAHKDCPVTTLQKKNAYLADESMKDVSEPTGSPAPVIQHSSLAPSLSSVGPNGLSARAAAEAVAMSVLAGMGSQPRAETSGGGASHVIMAAQSQPAAR
uniref:Cyclic AMP-dependent transcription factor ATF-7 n=1 Tax=Denticeps clupeoides TaxID=299321 RepID=A0AAY4EIZ6_9TELE